MREQAKGSNPQRSEVRILPGTVCVDVAAISDVGLSRSNNEDCFGYDLEAGLFLVCDGMGGMAAGEVASRVAVDQMMLHYRQQRLAGEDLRDSLHLAVQRSNQAVWRMAQERPDFRGMGTTMVAACVDGNRVLIGNVGDSRAYLVRDGRCQQVTHDHSYAAEQVRRHEANYGTEDKSIAKAMPQWITRAIGVGAKVAPDLFAAELTQQDVVLLASDGLTRYADNRAIAEIVANAKSLSEACNKLVALADQGGAEDNVTCLLLQIVREVTV